MLIIKLVLVACIFTAFVALVFSVLTLALGKVWGDFAVSGPEGWTFFDFYGRYLIIAGVYTFVTMLIGGWIGWGALFLAYKFVFDADWTQTLVIGIVGGIIAQVLFLALLFLTAGMGMF